MKNLLISSIVIIILTACGNTTISTGPKGGFGPLEVGLIIDSNGELALESSISIPLICNKDLGFGLNWETTFTTVLAQISDKHDYLVILWEEEDGHIWEQDYSLGQPFVINFEHDQWVRRIEHTQGGGILVFVEKKKMKYELINTPSAIRQDYVTDESNRISADGMILIFIPEGSFLMGSNNGNTDEKPEHTVFLTGFWIDKTEVTNEMYSKFINETGYRTDAEEQGYSIIYVNNAWIKVNGANWKHPLGPDSSISRKVNHPVVHISWDDSLAYCTWANRRLPTEAEWEKAARGTDGRIYPWGNNLPTSNLLNFNNIIGDTSEVGKYAEGASNNGVLDLAGNVWEWVNDWYSPDYYSSTIKNNPSGPTSGYYRIFRGGSFHYNGSLARSAYRGKIEPDHKDFNLGFRCAK